MRPRKANWDLKRDVVSFLQSLQPLCSSLMRGLGKRPSSCVRLPSQEKKLEKLEKRTQRAILDLIQQKLKDQADGSANINLNDAISKGQRQEETED